jgi:hypothetical protein
MSDAPDVAGWASSSHLQSLLNQHSKHGTHQQQQLDTSGLSGLLAAAESALCFKLGALLRLSRGLQTAATAEDNQKNCSMFYKQSQPQLRVTEQKRDSLLYRQAKGQQLSPEGQQQLLQSETFCMSASAVQVLQSSGVAAAAEKAWRDKQQQWREVIGELQGVVQLVGKLVTHVLSQLERHTTHQQC